MIASGRSPAPRRVSATSVASPATNSVTSATPSSAALSFADSIAWSLISMPVMRLGAGLPSPLPDALHRAKPPTPQ